MEPLKEQRSPELADLLASIREGSIQSFDRLYERTAPFILGLSCKLLGDRMEAEDVCHDVLLTVITDPGRYDPSRGSVEAWLAVLTKSKCVDRLRKRKKIVYEEPGQAEQPDPAGYGQPELHALRNIEREALRQALGHLPGLQQRTITAAFFDHRSQRDLAEAWKVPVGTVKSRVRYGLNHLRKTMERLGWAGREGGESGG